MFEIKLRNNKTFTCNKDSTIFDAAKKAGIILDHSCLNARCSSCRVKVISGSTEDVEKELVLTENEKKENFVLSCNAKPLSDLKLDIEDLSDIKFFDKKILPAKISKIKEINSDVLKIILRLPPTAKFEFNAGQYVNIIKDKFNRSYSMANKPSNDNQLEFLIKRYENGLMSKYWFEEAKENDLLRIEGPLGAFFLRDSNCDQIVFLATGTGVAPIKSIIESINKEPSKFRNKEFWLFVGMRYKDDLLYVPDFNNEILKINYIPVLSRQNENWDGEKGYVQHALLKQKIELKNAQVYACGSYEMVESAKKLLTKNSLPENNFFSDAFVPTN
jgi:CDP-4-dehydro-6-deoxyglucose reductase